MTSRTRVFYLSPSLFENFRVCFDERFVPFPSANKIASVLSSITAVGGSGISLSCPVVSAGERPFYGSRVLRGKGYLSVYLPAFRNRWLNRLTASVSYAVFCALNVRSSDRVILYNYSIEYVLAAVVLRLKGNPVIIDVEDGPRRIRRNFRELSSDVALKLLEIISSSRFISVATGLRTVLPKKTMFVNYGVAETLSVRHTPPPPPLCILFSGAKTWEWGVQMFLDAVRLIQKRDPLAAAGMRFLVTGFGDFNDLRALQAEMQGKIDIRIYENAGTAEYALLRDAAHIGLELRVPGSEGALTTFPSKVVELVSSGILLISTATGDVKLLLGENGAAYIPEATGDALCDMIFRVQKDWGIWRELAIKAQVNLHRTLSRKYVGERLLKFIQS